MTHSQDPNQKELLIRLDERVQQIQKDIAFLKASSIPTNEHIQLMKSMVEHETRLDNLESFNTRFLAYLAAASTVGGIVASLVISIVRDAINKWFHV